jgi:RimJ/RimL family protein N-acetyltransferase
MTPEQLTEALKKVPREIRTPRTSLRAPTLDLVDMRIDWIRASHDALEFIPGWRKNLDPDVAKRSIERDVRTAENGEEVIYNVFENSTGAFVGRLDLHTWDAEAPRCELGYAGDVRHIGRGLLREAATACVQLAFDIGAVRIQAITDTRNVRSIAFAKALGMQEEGVLRNYERLEGVLCDQVLLSMVRLPNQ